MYRRIDEVEKLQKVLQDTNKQFVKCMQTIKTLGEEKVARDKELEELKVAAQTIVDMVDPLEDETLAQRSLLEHLRDAPAKVSGFISEATKTYIAHTLALLVKSFWPKAQLECLAGGMAANCTEDQFEEYLKEVQPTTEKIVESLEQE